MNIPRTRKPKKINFGLFNHYSCGGLAAHLIKLVHSAFYELFSFNWFHKAIYGNQKQLAS